jgi:hypothetical protein
MKRPAKTMPQKHDCFWFHSVDAQHNICACNIHELWSDGEWRYFDSLECPKCGGTDGRD